MTLAVGAFDGTSSQWDAFVRSQPGWTNCHLFGWKAVIEAVFGHECLYLAARSESSQLRGVLPLVRVRSILFGHYLVSMPFVNYGGPLGDPEAVTALAARAIQQARTDHVKLLELRSRTELALGLPVSHRKITVTLRLPEGDAAPLWESLVAKVRSQVRRPQKEGVSVRFGLDQLDPFYGVFARHMRDLGTPVQAKALFTAIADAFGDDAWFGCAYLDGEAIAAGCGFKWGQEFEITWASSLREYNRIAPNMLLYWSFIDRCVDQAVRVFNFGRCSPGGGTHRFKRQWGGEDEQLWWYYDGAGDANGAPSPDEGMYALATRVWRRLPLAVTNRLGPKLVRYIP